MPIVLDKLTGKPLLVNVVTRSMVDGITEFYTGLPDALQNSGKVYIVQKPTYKFGFIIDKNAGIYYSDGIIWKSMPETMNAANVIFDNRETDIVATDVDTAIKEVNNAKLSLNQDTKQTLSSSPIFANGVARRIPYYATDKSLSNSSCFYVQNVTIGSQRFRADNNGSVAGLAFGIGTGMGFFRNSDTEMCLVENGAIAYYLNATQIKPVAVGTDLEPLYSTYSDSDTGMYFPEENTIALCVGGKSAMLIDKDRDSFFDRDVRAKRGFVAQNQMGLDEQVRLVSCVKEDGSGKIINDYLYITFKGGIVTRISEKEEDL